MTREELQKSLGTIAESGTAKFLKALKVTIMLLSFDVAFFNSMLLSSP